MLTKNKVTLTVKTDYNHKTRKWVGPVAGIDAVSKRKISEIPGMESRPLKE